MYLVRTARDKLAYQYCFSSSLQISKNISVSRGKRKPEVKITIFMLEHGVTKYSNLIGPLRESISLSITPFST